MKPQPPQRPDTYKYIKKETFKFDFSSFKNSLMCLFFGVLAIGYLVSGNKIENLIHAIVLLIGAGLGILGVYLFFASFKFSTKTERVSKNQNELDEERKHYDVAYVKYEEELTIYNRKLKEEQDSLEKQEQRKRLENERQKEQRCQQEAVELREQQRIKETFIKNIIPQIRRASFTELTNDEMRQTADYIWIYKSNHCQEHYEVNNIISKEDRWNDFSSIRSLNDHGHVNKIKGITPKFFAIICHVLDITGADGDPLIDYEKY